MKKILVTLSALAISTAAASAADLARKAPPPPPPPILYSWTGFYVGGHLGAGWARKEWSEPGHAGCDNLFVCDPGATELGLGSHNAMGVLGGFQAGYNYQIGVVVLGVEGQFSFADLKGDSQNSFSHTSTTGFFECGFLTACQLTDQFNSQERLSTSIRDIATLAGRLGVVSGPQDRTLWYVKGGGAWVRDNYAASIHASDLSCTNVISIFGNATACDNFNFNSNLFGNSDRWGWMVGTGVEWALIDNWSTKIEYDYLGFNSHNVTMAGFVPTGEGPHAISRTFNINQNISIIKIGLNYRFNWGAAPLVASY
jgi:outer membrane immunogenic protein